MWNHYLSSEVGYTYFTWSLELPKGFQFINKASIISPSPLPKHHGTQRNSKGHWVSDSLAPPWREIQPTPWRAALTGHVKGDNPLSSPSFVGHFTFVQSWHIRRLDNKGTYSLKKKQMAGHRQWRLCLCTCTQIKIQPSPQQLRPAYCIHTTQLTTLTFVQV